jgi:hypothetical protein
LAQKRLLQRSLSRKCVQLAVFLSRTVMFHPLSSLAHHCSRHPILHFYHVIPFPILFPPVSHFRRRKLLF